MSHVLKLHLCLSRVASHKHNALNSNKIYSLPVEVCFFYCHSTLGYLWGKIYNSQIFWDWERLARTKLFIKSVIFFFFNEVWRLFLGAVPTGKMEGRKLYLKAYYQVHFVSHMWGLYRKGSDIKGIDWQMVDFYSKHLCFFLVSYKVSEKETVKEKPRPWQGYTFGWLSLFC